MASASPTPAASVEALSVLLGPLRYATRDENHGLDRLRGFETLVGRVVERARAAGGPPELLDRLRDRVRGFDRLTPPARRTRVQRLLADLATVMVLPPELRPRPAFVGSDGAPFDARRRPDDVTLPAKPLDDSVAKLMAIPARLQTLLTRRGIGHLRDLLSAVPRAYEDRRVIRKIAELPVGEPAVTVATVKLAGEIRGRRGRRLYRILLADDSGTLTATWYNYPSWLRGRYPVGARYLVSGEIRAGYGNSREIAHPELEPAEELEADSVNFGRIVPIYSGLDRTEHRSYRRLTHRAVETAHEVSDPIPPEIAQRLGLPAIADAVRYVHWPPSDASIGDLNGRQTAAHRRLAFDELFLVQLGLALRRQRVKVTPGIAFRIDDAILGRAFARLPFSLTVAQRRVVGEIAADMARPEPMNRLLQGDVGSGKTAVALVSALIAVANRYQVAVMAPTELLAEQHYRTFSALLAGSDVRLALLMGGGRGDHDAVARQIAAGEVDVAIGTHALFQDSVAFSRLGLAIIDEQHRFGVLQRAALMRKGIHPDVLVMTATPIPRTLQMSYYGDLDLSVIDELPPGRLPVRTRVFGEDRREQVWRLVEGELREGRQAYVVYPLVEESEKVDLADATRGAETLAARFGDFAVGLVHGRMDRDEREAVMARFRAGEIRILVATTVVEVGVDVPNATVMAVESAERFGLSQLHQLRGRIRRSPHQASCYLIARWARSEGARERLAVMAKTDDGFVIAEKDLELRGPGEYLGTRQSGLPDVSLADVARYPTLLAVAREEAQRIVREDPQLGRPEHAPLRRALEEKWGVRLSLARVG